MAMERSRLWVTEIAAALDITDVERAVAESARLLADRAEPGGSAELQRVDITSNAVRVFLSGTERAADTVRQSLRTYAAVAETSCRECGLEDLVGDVRS